MPDREKVIKGLEVCISREPGKYTCYKCPYETDGNDCEIKMAEEALTLLREQEPVKPNNREIWFGTNGASMLEYHCGACGCGIVKNDRWQTKYCPECGRKVKWDADD